MNLNAPQITPGPLIAADLDSEPWHQTHMSQCLGACHADACDQGRKQCPTPQACEVEADEPPVGTGDLRLVLLLAVLAWALVLLAYRAVDWLPL